MAALSLLEPGCKGGGAVVVGGEDLRTVVASTPPPHGLDPSRVTSEASLLRVLLRVGSEGLRERVLDDGYAELANSIGDDDREESREARTRYVQRTERKVLRA